jgi:hypothetical protein
MDLGTVPSIDIDMCQWLICGDEFRYIVAYESTKRYDENTIFYKECYFIENYYGALHQLLCIKDQEQSHLRLVFTYSELNIYTQIDITGNHLSGYICTMKSDIDSISLHIMDNIHDTVISTVSQYIKKHLLDRIDLAKPGPLSIGIL